VLSFREMDAQPKWLTPWAAKLRYDEPIALDRTAALAAAESTVSWADALRKDVAFAAPENPGREEIPGGSSPDTSTEKQKTLHLEGFLA
jgi:hypothetical protein